MQQLLSLQSKLSFSTELNLKIKMFHELLEIMFSKIVELEQN